MAAPRQYGDDVREAIHQLVNVDGLSLPKARTALLGHFNRPIPEPTIGRIANELHRAHNPTPEAERTTTTVPELAQGLLALIETEIARLQAKNGALDADQALKLAKTINELAPVAKQKRSDNDTDHADTPLSTLEAAQTRAQARTREATHEARFASGQRVGHSRTVIPRG